MLFKTASSSSVQLGADDWSTTDYSTPLEASAIRVGRPNTRVVEAKIGTLDVLIYCDSDELNLSPKKGAITVTLFKNIWCEVAREKRGEDKHKQCYLVRKVPEAHEYDLLDYEGRSLPRWEKRYEARAKKALAQAAEEHVQLAIQIATQSNDDEPVRSPQITKQSSGSSASITAVDPLNIQIRNSPVQTSGRTSSPSVTFKPQLLTATTMSTTTTTQTATATTAAPAASGTAATPESIQKSLQKAMKRTGPPGGGGTPGGGSGGGGGGPLGGAPAGGAGGAPAQVPVPIAQNVRAAGHGPTVFKGDRTKAEHFLDEVRGYLSLNHQVAGFDSPIRKVCYALTHIKGPKVEGWVRDMWIWIDGLIQDYANNNIPAVWDGFITEFTQQFSDSQKEQRARIKLKEHCFKYPEIDSFISKFEDLARLAGYTQGSPEATELFLEGLPVDILKEVMQSPRAATYAETKERAIDAVRTKQTLEAIMKKMASGNSPGFSSFRQGPT